jgi:Dolichyl-phosphate-mannose-protein mannosyltransferase
VLLKENQIAPLSSKSSQRAIVLWASYGVFLSVYLALTLKAAVHNPLWMDEVLSVWASRFPSPSQIYQALMHGAQSSPPAYSWMLHYCARIFGDSNLTYRLPSILAAITTGIVSLALLRRYLDTPSSVFASCLILETLSPFGLQARPYTIVTLCFTITLLLWDDLDRGLSMWRVAAIALLLSTATAFHFYAVLFVACFGLMELFRTFRTRNVRFAVWLALVLAGGSIFLWFPIMRATSQFVAQDVVASHAYGPSPTVPSLISTYSYLFQGLGNIRLLGGLGMNGLIVLCALCLIPFGRLYKHGGTDATASRKAGNQKNNFWIVVLGSLLLPLIVFVFSLVVTKTFNLRYAIAGSIGASALLAEVLSGFPYFRRVVPAILLVASILMLKFGVPSMEFFDHSAIYKALPGRDPIVVADGSQFFQLEESAPVAFRSRLVYLIVPPEVAIGDATNLHAIMRWKKIRPDLPVENARTFLSEHGRYYVLDERTADDTPATFLLREGKIDPWDEVSGAMLYRSRPSSLSDAW